MKKFLSTINPLRLLRAIWRIPKKFLIPGILILAVLIYFFVLPKSDTTKVQTAEAKQQDVKSIVAATGVLAGKNTANLKFQTSGKVSYVNVKAGQTVYKGQVLEGLDTRDLYSALQQAKNTLRDKQAIVTNTLDQVKNHSSDENFDQRQQRTSDEVARDNAYDNVQIALRNFEDATIVSPISGTLTQLPILVGQPVSASELAAEVVDWSEVYFTTDIDEADISKISIGQESDVTLNAYSDQIFPGKVAEIVPQTKTTSSGGTVVSVKILLDDPQIKLISNLNGQAEIILDKATNVLAVPLDALTSDDKVLIQNGSTYQIQLVKTGFKSDSDVEITEGLKAGDKVVLNPQTMITQMNTSNNNIFTRISRSFRGLSGDSGRNR